MPRLKKLTSYEFWRTGMGGRIPATLDFLKSINQAASHYNSNKSSIYRRFLELYTAGFTFPEMRLWGLLDPALKPPQLSEYISKKALLRFQATQSPRTHAALLEDKEVFYRYALSLGLPVPRSVAYLSKDVIRSGESRDTLPASDLEELLADLDGTELVLKPTNGVYGRGFREFIARQGGGLVDENGQPHRVKAILRSLEPNTRYVLQHRLSNHPHLTEMTRVRTLQTIRAITAVPAQPCARGRLLSASWRLVPSNKKTDNFQYGRDGNMRALVDPATGVIVRTIRAATRGFGIEDVKHHPLSQQALTGQQLPYWDELRDLVETTSASFYPIRLVGWDVAITPSGPVILEGNFWFDPENLGKPIRYSTTKRRGSPIVWDPSTTG